MLQCEIEVGEKCFTFDIECEEHTVFGWSTRVVICVFYLHSDAERSSIAVRLILEKFTSLNCNSARSFDHCWN